MGGPDFQRDGKEPFGSRGNRPLRALVHILEERCKGCGFCIEFCPRGVFAASERYNLKGYHPPDIVALEACTACDLCELLCPDFAIGIEELEPVPHGRAVQTGLGAADPRLRASNGPSRAGANLKGPAAGSTLAGGT